MTTATLTTTKYKKCIAEKTNPLKCIKPTRSTCRLHPLRANCRAIKRRHDHITDNDNVGSDVYYYHETTLNTVYLDYNCRGYYEKLVDPEDDTPRGHYLSAHEMYAYVHLAPLDDDETFYGIDEAGERQLTVVTMVIKNMMTAFEKRDNYVFLFVEELQMDLVYSIFRAVTLPQRVFAIPFDDNAPTLDNFVVVSVPATDEAIVSQHIYRMFIIYNTVLTMILKQRNPYNESTIKSISIVLRTLGKCPNNKERVKCCDLKYGGNAPGHVMCAPRAMLKRIFHYAKWARTPNNYKRYFELIAKPTQTERQLSQECRRATINYNDFNYALMDWYHFMVDFRAFFGIGN
ncbi:vp1054 [Orgyia leucostigma nucleopolyhedrovirus]|uniref:Vp1054 n=1 Tax=Orgyia leucostigma nucleopolyhedrovirus TaxID=490711 RepID=B0FDQ6_9ABAC|nr:vp1054 [Orgyia leucostigma nucleopolyhedrovirus]ABY65764.1 vp1054 [Orgyia leucostigma nucleopolyhedrovirus]